MKHIEYKLNEILEVLEENGVPNNDWVRKQITETLELVKNNGVLHDVSNLTLEEGKQMVDFGFWYATESMHDGSVPVGNYLQRLMYVKGLVNSPKEWDDYKRKNGYDC